VRWRKGRGEEAGGKEGERGGEREDDWGEWRKKETVRQCVWSCMQNYERHWLLLLLLLSALLLLVLLCAALVGEEEVSLAGAAVEQ